ncbi:MAG: CsgG/HfaB family protein [Patescibacteria group bacterium]|mgnify:CR=1 FL=1
MRALSSVVAVAILATCASPASAAPKKQLEIPHCVRPIGTVALVEPKVEAGVQPWWTGMGLGSPELVLKAYIVESNCFKLVNRGRGMETAERERALAAAGVLRPRSNIGGGQVTAADYVLVPDMLSGNSNASGSAVTGILGSMIGGQFGAILGGFSSTSRTADVMITLMNARTAEDDEVFFGKAKKTDLGWGAGAGTVGSTGAGAAALGGYTNTELGQVIMTAYLDAYIQLVNRLGGLNPEPAQAAPRVALVTTTAVKMREGPSTSDKEVRVLALGALLYPTGREAQGWVEVEDEMQFTGWVSKLYLAPAK